MRLIKQSIDRDGSGSMALLPEEDEDMWFSYNLIRPSDLLRASAVRRVTTESATGSTSSTRVHINLLISVEKLDFDTQSAQLHVSGRIVEETKYTKVGQYHTLDLELNRNFTLQKKEGWDSVARELVREACDPVKSADVWAVVMQEGLAHLAVLTGHRTVLRQKVEMTVPKKRGTGKQGDHDKVGQVGTSKSKTGRNSYISPNPRPSKSFSKPQWIPSSDNSTSQKTNPSSSHPPASQPKPSSNTSWKPQPAPPTKPSSPKNQIS